MDNENNLNNENSQNNEKNISGNPYAADKKVFSRIGFACFAVTAISTLLSVGVSLYFKYFYPEMLTSPYVTWGNQIVCMYLTAIPLGLLILRRGKRQMELAEKPSKSNMSLGEIITTLIICCPMMYVGSILGSILNSFISSFGGNASTSGLEAVLSTGPLWLIFLMVVVIGPIMEEVFFRYGLIEALRPWGWKAAAWISAGIFGLFHGNLEQLFYTVFLGLLLGCVYLKTGKLRYSVIIHMSVNFFSGFIPVLIMTKFFNEEGMELLSNPDLINEILSNVEKIGEYSVLLSKVAPYMVMLLGYYGVLLGFFMAGSIIIWIYRRKFTFKPGERKVERAAIGDTFFMAPGMMVFIITSVALMIFSAVISG